MQYYKVIVAYLVQSDDEETAQQQTTLVNALLTSVVSVTDVTEPVEQVIHKYHHPQPEKGLY